MTHPIHSSQQLLNRGLLKVKKIAADLGVIPTGDKRLIQSWIDAIIEHQAAQVQKIEVVEATIDFESESFEGSTQPYMVLVNGEVVHRTTTYQQAERHCKWQGYTLVDSQTLAQSELEVEMEAQAVTRAEKAKSIEVLEQVEDEGFVKFIVKSNENLYTVTPAHPLPKERCECGDVHFRGVECKHQLAVKEKIASQISFISPTGFGYHEAIANGNVHHVIATIEYFSDRDCDQPWWNVVMNRKSRTLASYEEAEKFIKDEYVNGVFMHRGSGRMTQPIEDTSMTIEDSNFIHDFGQSYTIRVHGVLAGSIFLSDDHGWAMNGEDFSQEWQPVARELVGLTRREYFLSAY